MKKSGLFLPKFWMTASLALLAGFLVLFLKKTWDDERDALAKEVGYIFVGAVRRIEGRLLDDLVLRKNLPPPDRFGMPQALSTKSDTVRVVTFFKNEEMTVVQGHEPKPKIDIKIQREGGENEGISDLKGSISMVIALDHDKKSLAGDSTFTWRDGNFFPQLVASFDSFMAVADLTAKHRVVRLAANSPDTLPQLRGSLQTGSYTDLASGERFVAEISDYNMLIFRKILPQIALAALVFGMVALAFFSIWKNLLRQQKLAALRNDLLQNISHELKTPVSTVGVALEALRDFEVMKNPQRTSEYLEIAQNELTRLTLLVDKVLGMAQFEKDALPMRRANFDFKKMVEEVLAAMRLQFEKHRAMVNFEAQSEDFSMLGDRLHLAGVVFNLLDNALKYGGDPPEISIQLAENQENIKLTITDNGPGVPPEFEQKVFEKFFRVPTGAVHDVKGHGLGLSYVAAVVGQHGGSVAVYGSVFTLTLRKSHEKN